MLREGRVVFEGLGRHALEVSDDPYIREFPVVNESRSRVEKVESQGVKSQESRDSRVEESTVASTLDSRLLTLDYP